MSFADAVRVCLTQRYANFSGRARRSEYWYFTLFLVLVYVVFAVLVAVLGNSTAGTVLAAVLGLSALAVVVPSVAVSVRRLHDIGRSGWWLLISLIPLGGLVLLVFHCLDSTPDNQWGPNPKGLGGGYGFVPGGQPQYPVQGGYGTPPAAGYGQPQPPYPGPGYGPQQ